VNEGVKRLWVEHVLEVVQVVRARLLTELVILGQVLHDLIKQQGSSGFQSVPNRSLIVLMISESGDCWDNPQRTGFAIRRGLVFTANPDFEELDVGGVRRGTDLTVMLDGQSLRLLSVHLKSFCHRDDLDNVSPSDNTDCGRLKRQIPILESWIEARVQEGVPLVVLGDFNRRFNIADDDTWRELDDGDPDLAKHTEGLTSACLNAQFPEYIDHIVTDTRATGLVRSGSFEQLLFTTVDPGGQARLSDHCPIAMVFETEVTPAAGDPIADILARLEAVQAELRDIKAAVGDLRE
jgi:hypothetical protein